MSKWVHLLMENNLINISRCGLLTGLTPYVLYGSSNITTTMTTMSQCQIVRSCDGGDGRDLSTQDRNKTSKNPLHVNQKTKPSKNNSYKKKQETISTQHYNIGNNNECRLFPLGIDTKKASLYL